MQVDTLFTISCSGCSEHEIHLLKHQIKMLQSKTRLNWVFAVPSKAAQADLKIRHSVALNKTVASFGSGLTALHFQLSWPLRVQGFLALLERCENTLLSALDNSQNKPVLEQLNLLVGASEFTYQGSLVRFIPEQDCIQSNLVSFELLLNLLRQNPKPLQPVPNRVAIDPNLQSYSMKKVLWALALDSKLTAQSRWYEGNAEFQIDAWPLLGEWKSNSAIMRLAALFSRQFCTLDKAKAFANVSTEQVANFLHACQAAGIGVRKRPLRVRKDLQAEVTHALSEKGFFARLRDRLGLSFSRAY